MLLCDLMLVNTYTKLPLAICEVIFSPGNHSVDSNLVRLLNKEDVESLIN